MGKETLLDKAKKHKRISKVVVNTKQMEELSLAWCRDEVTLTQIARALGLDNTGHRVYGKVANSLKNYLNVNYAKTLTNGNK